MIPNFQGCFEYNPEENPLQGRSQSEKEQFAFEYMAMWIREGEFDDFSIMFESGDSELMAHALVEAGAIDSSQCYESCVEIERIIESWSKTFRKLSFKKQRERYDQAFKNCITVECHDCNHHQFPSDRDFELYEDELRRSCWECGSKNITIQP